MIKVYPRKFLDYSYGNISSALAFTLNPFLDEDKIIDEIQKVAPVTKNASGGNPKVF